MSLYFCLRKVPRLLFDGEAGARTLLSVGIGSTSDSGGGLPEIWRRCIGTVTEAALPGVPT
jgi:hypothetical protein